MSNIMLNVILDVGFVVYIENQSVIMKAPKEEFFVEQNSITNEKPYRNINASFELCARIIRYN